MQGIDTAFGHGLHYGHGEVVVDVGVHTGHGELDSRDGRIAALAEKRAPAPRGGTARLPSLEGLEIVAGEADIESCDPDRISETSRGDAVANRLGDAEVEAVEPFQAVEVGEAVVDGLEEGDDFIDGAGRRQWISYAQE